MNRTITKTNLLYLCVFMCFLRGVGLNFTEDNEIVSWTIDLAFSALILPLLSRWFILDAEERGHQFEDAKARSKFGRGALLFPLYFRQIHAKNTWRANLLAIGFGLLCYGIMVFGGVLGIILLPVRH